jgi:hypothetical protein
MSLLMFEYLSHGGGHKKKEKSGLTLSKKQTLE